MRIISAETTIGGSSEQVWAVLADFTRYPEWNPFIRAAEGFPGAGSRLRVRIHPPGGRAMTFRPVIVSSVPGSELRWIGRVLIPGLLDGEHAFRIHPLSELQVRFEQSERFTGILVPLLPSSLYEDTRRGFELMNAALRERVEAGR